MIILIKIFSPNYPLYLVRKLTKICIINLIKRTHHLDLLLLGAAVSAGVGPELDEADHEDGHQEADGQQDEGQEEVALLTGVGPHADLRAGPDLDRVVGPLSEARHHGHHTVGLEADLGVRVDDGQLHTGKLSVRHISHQIGKLETFTCC